MDDIFVYCVKLPCGTKEMVTPCNAGYTVYIDESLNEIEQKSAYAHALEHIKNNDFMGTKVNEMEYIAHYRQKKTRCK